MQTSGAVLGLAILAASAATSAVAAGQNLRAGAGVRFLATPLPTVAVTAAPADSAPGAPAARRGEAASAATLFAKGARVRLRVPVLGREKIAGLVLHAQGDSVVIDTVDATVERRMFFPNTILVDAYRTVTLPVSMVDSVEVSAGRSRSHGMLHHAKRGALILGLLGAATFRGGDGTPTLRNVGVGALNGFALGFALGGAYGATQGGERWRVVERERTIAAR